MAAGWRWGFLGCAFFLMIGASPDRRGLPDPKLATAPWGHSKSLESDSLVVRELDSGIWLHTSWRQLPGGVDVPANGLLVRTEEGLWLLDTAWGEELTFELLEWVDSELGIPVIGAIVTHFHDDSMGGTGALEARGIPSWAHPLSLELGAGRGPLPQAIGNLGVGESVAIGGMEIFYPGPGHTEDNIMVWLPDARILFGGCAVRPGSSSSLGNVEDANLSEWPHSILRAKHRFPEVVTVVPTHGDPGDGSLLDHTVGLLSRARTFPPGTPAPRETPRRTGGAAGGW